MSLEIGFIDIHTLSTYCKTDWAVIESGTTTGAYC